MVANTKSGGCFFISSKDDKPFYMLGYNLSASIFIYTVAKGY